MLVGTRARNKAMLRDVVFDSDGTLTLPVIDFQAMYREVFRPEAYVVAKQGGGGSIDILCHDSLQVSFISLVTSNTVLFTVYFDALCKCGKT